MARFLNPRSLLALIICTTLGACASKQRATLNSASAEKSYNRIVSLAPSNTELIYSLQAEDKLIGRSKFCDYPPQVKAKTVVGDFVSPNIERLKQAKPQIILLVNGQENMGGLLKRHQFKTETFDNLRIGEIPRNLRSIGEMTNTASRANMLALQFEHSVSGLRKIITSSKRPRVLFVAWPQPLITAGGASFVNDCITAAGGINVTASMKSSYPQLSRESLMMSEPDIVIFPHEAAAQTFWKGAPWTALAAIKQKHFYFLPPPDQDGLSRPTLRVVDGLYWLSSRIHPESEAALASWYAEAKRPVTASGIKP